ncbi:unnamed protein product [Cuscuta epithymum]|uniref:Protein COFACTOR ASSEMBLY OF COMPLEX C SUBUNIT B CCB3, chloroplastic n=2 Tax=Cuscuta epithymum TaxID=186058 RepID=A0AAV0DJR2_9ASTE|nr:unnamed protein product [Cuscuta epithymum]
MPWYLLGFEVQTGCRVRMLITNSISSLIIPALGVGGAHGKLPSFKKGSRQWEKARHKTSCSFQVSVPPGVQSMKSNAGQCFNSQALALVQRLALLDLDPSTAKLAIGFVEPLLSVFSFLFILRIVMSWYPKLPVWKFPYVIVYAPTEPFLSATRKVIPPLGGVDVTPVVWFGLVSFLNEILVGPQGLLVLLSQQLGS